MSLLAVLSAAPASPEQARALLRRARLMLAPGVSLLLICDLPDSDAAKTPEDDALIRLLQSGTMSADPLLSGRLLLLVRRRVWDDAARAYLGAGQPVPPWQVAAQLLTGGQTDTAFEAATFSPASLKGQYGTILLMSDVLACTPDTPVRMVRALEASGKPCLRGRILPFRPPEETALSRLACAGFDLSPLLEAHALRLRRQHLALPGDATVFSAASFAALAHGNMPASPCPLAEDCLFVRSSPETPGALLRSLRARQASAFGALARERDNPHARLHAAIALLPLAQLLLLLLAALLGSAPLAALTVLVPEGYALLHPRLLPGALVRLALLPARAMCAFDAGMARLLARSPRFRVELSPGAMGAPGCALIGAALLALAFRTIYALAPLLLVCLLWLSAPLLFPALASPLHEKVPLDAQERAQLSSLAEASFYTLSGEESPPRLMLAACAGCMLRLLEPDEAARRVSSLLARLEEAPPALGAGDIACLLASAQYLREQMGDCDAALRPLPAQLDALARAMPEPVENGPLAAFLSLCRAGDASGEALDALRARLPLHSDEGSGSPGALKPLDALFLPRVLPAHASPALMPLTHPHAFLRSQLLESDADGTDAVDRFLVLAAALGLPFGPLLLRSPAVAPYAPVLMQL